ncbi:MAG: glycosyltransferase [Bacilli bacterium]|nr:glycosyltransferase [Bacilli bacterium]
MILVTVGTQAQKFNRLLEAIEEQIKKGNIKDEVIVQGGTSLIDSKNMKIFKSFPMEEFDALVKRCDLLITHGGVGSITTGLRYDKTVIAIPRLKQYNEHVNDHQVQIVENFNNAGYIIGVFDLDKLDEGLKKVKTFKPNKFTSNTMNMIKLLEDYIDNI